MSRILVLPSQIDDDCFCLDFFSGAIPQTQDAFLQPRTNGYVTLFTVHTLILFLLKLAFFRAAMPHIQNIAAIFSVGCVINNECNSYTQEN